MIKELGHPISLTACCLQEIVFYKISTIYDVIYLHRLYTHKMDTEAINKLEIVFSRIAACDTQPIVCALKFLKHSISTTG